MPQNAFATAPAQAAPRHPNAIVAAHWLTAVAILLAFALVLSRELAEGDFLRAGLLNAHRVSGLLVGLLAISRVLFRWRKPMARPVANAARSQRWAAAAVHGLLYALLLTLPVLGVLLTNARGHLVVLPGLGSLPPLVGQDLDWADDLEEWHGDLAWLLAGLVGLHTAAALWHHFARKNNVLRAMAPWLRGRT